MPAETREQRVDWKQRLMNAVNKRACCRH